MYFVYFFRSLRSNKVYVGFTRKVPEDRLSDHHYGSSNWTKDNGPFELIYYEKYHCQKDVITREKFYKSGFGRQIRDSIISSVSAKGGPASGGG